MIISSEQEMLDFGRNFAKTLKIPAVIELIGDVGAGKTTFTRGLAEGLKIEEPVTSPSFTISKSYAVPNGHLVHYDFYRLEDPGLMAEDLSENLNNPNNIIIIEWGKSIADFLPENHIKIQITYTDNGRNIEVIS
jgi:tRNA threonylcarbamoyladenosine biosynthesis protein TsaE